jgi:hypothetical protein
MKIIKKGKIVPIPKQITCFKCKSVLSYESKDVKVDRDGDYIECPVCQAFNGASKFSNHRTDD